VPIDFISAALPAIIEAVAGLELSRTTLIIAAHNPTWNQLVRHQTVEFPMTR
jgi:hypothetical protein